MLLDGVQLGLTGVVTGAGFQSKTMPALFVSCIDARASRRLFLAFKRNVSDGIMDRDVARRFLAHDLGTFRRVWRRNIQKLEMDYRLGWRQFCELLSSRCAR